VADTRKVADTPNLLNLCSKLHKAYPEPVSRRQDEDACRFASLKSKKESTLGIWAGHVRAVADALPVRWNN